MFTLQLYQLRMTELYSQNMTSPMDGQVGMPRRGPTPPSRTRSGTQRPTTAERLTPVPDYMGPLTRSSAKKFRKLHEDHMMDKLLQKRSAKKERNTKTRDQARDLARKIPMEALAKDWYSNDEETAETRAYLVDKIMPTLIMGVEKLLIEVDKKDLSDKDEPDPNFNPLNFLAQYLMRNNPKYSNFGEASPYVRGLRSIGEELRKQLFDLEENRLARIKADAKRKREEREHEEMLQNMEKKRRSDTLAEQFAEWEDTKSTQGIEPKISMALLQNALRSFMDVTEQLPEPLRSMAKFSQDMDPTDDTGRTLGGKEFALYINQFVDEMPSELFNTLVRHLSSCASSHKSRSDREQRKAVLDKLFLTCDHTGVGLLDRKRMLNLFEMFYDKAQGEIKENLRNPRKWPVIDVQEIDSYPDSDDEGEAAEPIKLIDNNIDKTEETQKEEVLEEKDTQQEKEVEKDDTSQEKELDKDSDTQKEKVDESKPEDVPEITQEPAEPKDTEGTPTEQEETSQKIDGETEAPPEATEDVKPEDEPVQKEEPENQVQPEPINLQVEEKTPPSQTEAQKEEAEDLELLQLKSAGKPPMTQGSKVSFAEGIVMFTINSWLII